MARYVNDWWLEQKISSPNTVSLQNYFPLLVNSELEAALGALDSCIKTETVEGDISFDGWDIVSIPTEYGSNWLWSLYAADIGYMIVAGSEADSSAPGRAMTSPDGVTWTWLSTPLGNFWWKPIYVDSKDLIVVPTDGSGGTNFLTSDDVGVTWNAGTTGFGNATMKGIIWSEEKALYVAWGWSGPLRYSTDLLTWFEATISTGGGYWDDISDIAYSPALGIFCTTGIYGDVYTSTDGMSWTWQNLGSFQWDSNWTYITWSPTLALFVAQGEHHENFSQTEMFMSSPDGVTWTIRPLGIALTQHNTDNGNTFLPALALQWDAYTSEFYALTKADNNSGDGNSLITPSMYLVTSTDGITWVIDSTVPNTQSLSYPVFGTKAYVDVAFKDATNMIMLNSHSVTRRI